MNIKTKLYHLLPVGGILILLGAASVYAQTHFMLKATIPFAFKVQNKALPAGDYTISFDRDESKDAIWIRNQAATVASCAITTGHTSKRTHDDPYLVFNRYGDQYFLSQVWAADRNIARKLATSRAEQELLRSGPSELAGQKTTPAQITIAAR